MVTLLFQTLTDATVHLPDANQCSAWLIPRTLAVHSSQIKLTAPFVASSINSPYVTPVNDSESNITTAPHLSRISLFSIADCFNSSRHTVGTVDASECVNTPPLSTTTQPLCPDARNASTLCGTRVYSCLPSGWSGTCALLFPSPKLGVWYPAKSSC